MTSKKKIQTVDVTPTWRSLVQPMLDSYVQHCKVIDGRHSKVADISRSIDQKNFLFGEFMRMAMAADVAVEDAKSKKGP